MITQTLFENNNPEKLIAPFPYFGGKSPVVDIIWQALGDVKHYMEPFFGSGVVLLNRPNYDYTRHVETVNDKDGYLVNAWRALKYNPEEVAYYCDYPVIHVDLHARRKKLIEAKEYLLKNLLDNEEWYDAKLAGYWIWGMGCWIGGSFLDEKINVDFYKHCIDKDKGLVTSIPRLSNAGCGVHKITMRDNNNQKILNWFNNLSKRLKYVRIVNGDWSRICNGHWQDFKNQTVGIFFDPPYSVEDRSNVYSCEDYNVAKEVEEWCLERGKLKNYRIVCAGYIGEYDRLIESGWKVMNWKNHGGYGNQGRKDSQGKKNKYREILVFSPYSLY